MDAEIKKILKETLRKEVIAHDIFTEKQMQVIEVIAMETIGDYLDQIRSEVNKEKKLQKN
jgi:hypothetical protein